MSSKSSHPLILHRIMLIPLAPAHLVSKRRAEGETGAIYLVLRSLSDRAVRQLLARCAAARRWFSGCPTAAQFVSILRLHRHRHQRGIKSLPKTRFSASKQRFWDLQWGPICTWHIFCSGRVEPRVQPFCKAVKVSRDSETRNRGTRLTRIDDAGSAVCGGPVLVCAQAASLNRSVRCLSGTSAGKPICPT